MVPVRIVLFACCLMAACSGTPSPQLPLGVAQDLRNKFVVDSSDYLAEARAAEAALNYALCLDNLQRFALAEPEKCDASFWQWQARVAENVDNSMQVLLNAQLQWLTFTPNDVWLRNAKHANTMASLLSKGLATFPDIKLVHPTQANEVFVNLPSSIVKHLNNEGYDGRHHNI